MVQKKTFGFFGIFVLIILAIGIVFASHILTPSSTKINEDTSTLFNITINNSDINQPANITQVNITLLNSNLSFVATTNGTTSAAPAAFVNSSTVASWLNSTNYLINGSEVKNFWINLTGTQPGTYTITITTTNASASFQQNVSLVVSDITRPAVVVAIPVNNTATDTSLRIEVGINATDNLAVSSVTANIKLPNATVVQATLSRVGSTAKYNSSYFIPNLAGEYNITYVVADAAGNTNSTERTNFTVTDVTPPSVKITSPGIDEYATQTVTITATMEPSEKAVCNYHIDSGSAVVLSSADNLTYTGTSASLSNGAHRVVLNCTDSSVRNNSNVSESVDFVINYVDSTVGGGSGGATTYPTYTPTATELSEGYTRTIYKNSKVSVKVENQTHTVTLDSVATNSVTLTVASTPQTATLNVGEEKKFEVTGDGYYDVKVKLNSVSGIGASITTTSIHEAVSTAASTGNNVAGQDPSTQNNTIGAGTTAATSSGMAWWIWLIIVVVVIIIVVVLVMKAKKN